MERLTGIEFEYYVAKFYANKISHCKTRWQGVHTDIAGS